jgi:chromosome segregation ATPase
MAITRDEVKEAAEALRDEGINPTYLSIRQKLGRGSFSTISKHLRAYLSTSHRLEQSVRSVEPLPNAIRALAEPLLVKLWSEITAQSQMAFDELRQRLEQNLLEKDDTLKEASTALDLLMSEHEKSLELVANLRSELEKLQVERLSLEQLKNEATMQKDAHAKVAQEKSVTIESLKTELSKDKAQLIELQSLVDQYKDRDKVVSATIENQALELASLRALSQGFDEREKKSDQLNRMLEEANNSLKLALRGAEEKALLLSSLLPRSAEVTRESS